MHSWSADIPYSVWARSALMVVRIVILQPIVSVPSRFFYQVTPSDQATQTHLRAKRDHDRYCDGLACRSLGSGGLHQRPASDVTESPAPASSLGRAERGFFRQS